MTWTTEWRSLLTVTGVLSFRDLGATTTAAPSVRQTGGQQQTGAGWFARATTPTDLILPSCCPASSPTLSAGRYFKTFKVFYCAERWPRSHFNGSDDGAIAESLLSARKTLRPGSTIEYIPVRCQADHYFPLIYAALGRTKELIKGDDAWPEQLKYALPFLSYRASEFCDRLSSVEDNWVMENLMRRCVCVPPGAAPQVHPVHRAGPARGDRPGHGQGELRHS